MDAFSEFERARWQAVAAPYHDYFGGLTSQSIGPLLDAVRAARGTRLLDVASGPGYVAAAAARRGGGVAARRRRDGGGFLLRDGGPGAPAACGRRFPRRRRARAAVSRRRLR